MFTTNYESKNWKNWWERGGEFGENVREYRRRVVEEFK
jgi:hypothetical protein